MSKKVSIITTCLNGEQFLNRYFKSIIKQTYSDIELIFINDGSTDNTKEIAMYYKTKIEQKGYRFIYIEHENCGHAASINAGLKKITGEYFVWPDSDDMLAEDSIEKKVHFLEQNPDYAIVRTDAYCYDENDLENPMFYISKKQKERFEEHLFDRYVLDALGAWRTPGCFMVRTEFFFKINPTKQIYVSPKGHSQNNQMLLPMFYVGKCGYIDEPLYYFVVRKDSYSRSFATKDKKLARYEYVEEIEKEVISEIDGINEKYYANLIEYKYFRLRLKVAVDYCDKKLAVEEYKKFKIQKTIKFYDKFLILLTYWHLLNKGYLIIEKINFRIKMQFTKLKTKIYLKKEIKYN